MRHAMRRLRLHYGKLAAAVLLAVTLSLLWWALPVRPSVSCHLGSAFSCVGFADDGRMLFIKKKDCKPSKTEKFVSYIPGSVIVLDPNTGVECATLFSDNQALERVEISPNGRWLAALLERTPRKLKVLEVATGVEVASLPAIQKESVRRMEFQFAPDSRTLAFTMETEDRSQVVLWDLETRQKWAEFPGQEGPLVFGPDSRTIATTEIHLDLQNDIWSTISVWDCSTCLLVR